MAMEGLGMISCVRAARLPVLRSNAMFQELDVKFRSSSTSRRSNSSLGMGAFAERISSLA